MQCRPHSVSAKARCCTPKLALDGLILSRLLELSAADWHAIFPASLTCFHRWGMCMGACAGTSLLVSCGLTRFWRLQGPSFADHVFATPHIHIPQLYIHL